MSAHCRTGRTASGSSPKSATCCVASRRSSSTSSSRRTQSSRVSFPRRIATTREAEEEYRRLVGDALASGRLETLRLLRTTAHADRLTDADADAWCSALNDLRLVLGERLGVTEELEERGIDLEHPNAVGLSIYGWLTWLQSEVIDASRRIPTTRRLGGGANGRSSARLGQTWRASLSSPYQPSRCLAAALGLPPASTPDRPSGADQREHLVPLRCHLGLGQCLEVEPQKRLGVRRPDVEVPVVEVDREPVEMRDPRRLRRRSAPSAPGA